MEKLKALTPSDILSPYYKPPIGSIRYSLRLVSKLVGLGLLVDDPQLRARIDRAITDTEEAARSQFQWTSHQRKESMRREGVMEADNVADRALSAFSTMLDGYLRLDATNPRQKAADALIKHTMPRGVGVITHQRFEAQHMSTDLILEHLDTDGLAHVQLLHLESFVDEIRDANTTYGQLLSSLDNTGITYPEVKAAYRIALDGFFGTILTVWSNFLDDPETRNALLAPIYEQNERIRAYLKSRKKTPRVDPTTGEILEGDEDTAENEAELVLDMNPNPTVNQPTEDAPNPA